MIVSNSAGSVEFIQGLYNSDSARFLLEPYFEINEYFDISPDTILEISNDNTFCEDKFTNAKEISLHGGYCGRRINVNHRDIWIANSSLGAIYHIDNRCSPPVVTILGTGSPEVKFLEAIRIIRTILVNALERSGYVLLHGGALQVGDIGMFICAPSGSGKTSFISRLCQGLDAPIFVSNDKCLSSIQADNRSEVLGLPLCVNMSAALYQAVSPNWRPGSFDHSRHGERYIWPQSFCEMVDARIGRSTIIDYIVVPQFAKGQPLSISRLGADDAHWIVDAIVNFSNEISVDWLLKMLGCVVDPNRDKRPTVAHDLARSCKIVSIKGDFWQSPVEGVETLVKRIIEA